MTSTLPRPPRQPRRVVYLGTPDVAVPPLIALHHAGFDIALVVTRPDKRRGRGGKLSPSPVKAAALELGLPVAHDLDAATEVGADAGVVVAYGRLISRGVLEALPMVNLHFSLLPRWRGAAPVERAILAGDTETGVCLMAVDIELDTGDVYHCESTPIDPDETLDELRSRLVEMGAGIVVSQLSDGLSDPVPQVGEATYAAKIDSVEHRLDLQKSALELHRVVRLGRAWTTFRGKRLKVLKTELAALDPRSGPDVATDTATPGLPGSLDGPEVVTGDGRLGLVTVQPEGKRLMAAGDWLNGAQAEPGERLGT